MYPGSELFVTTRLTIRVHGRRVLALGAASSRGTVVPAVTIARGAMSRTDGATDRAGWRRCETKC